MVKMNLRASERRYHSEFEAKMGRVWEFKAASMTYWDVLWGDAKAFDDYCRARQFECYSECETEILRVCKSTEGFGVGRDGKDEPSGRERQYHSELETEILWQ